MHVNFADAIYNLNFLVEPIARSLKSCERTR